MRPTWEPVLTIEAGGDLLDQIWAWPLKATVDPGLGPAACPTDAPTLSLPADLGVAALSHPVGLTRPAEMPASADAEDQRNEGEVPEA